jgi:S1-C subfamily serine protease
MTTQFVWTCPQCARSVPNKLEVCRCGCARPAAAVRPAAAELEPLLGPAPPPLPDVHPGAPAATLAGLLAAARGMGGNRTMLIAVVAGAVVVLTGLGVLSAVRLRAGTTGAAVSATVPSAGVAAVTDDPLPPAPLGDAPPVAADPAGAPAEPAPMLSTEEIVTRSMPAVVTVVTRDGFGSGFFVASDTVITNAHVIEGNDVVTLRRAGGYSRLARVGSVSHDIDLAVLKVDIADFDQVVLPFAGPNDVTIGADVIAIGSPLGLANTVTRGIVSGKRSLNNVNLVQTDAAINPGNSGGPLLDRRGRVIGVNTMKLGRGAEGMAFAVSIRYVPLMLGAAYAPKSERDERLEKGLKEYTENLRGLARRVDTVDANWKSFRASCEVMDGQLVERQWFALWDGRPTRMRDSPSCRAWQGYFKESAVSARDALQRHEAAARSMGLLAEQTRAVRRRLNMTFPGWEP